jgi:hypothetical protein
MPSPILPTPFFQGIQETRDKYYSPVECALRASGRHELIASSKFFLPCALPSM